MGCRWLSFLTGRRKPAKAADSQGTLSEYGKQQPQCLGVKTAQSDQALLSQIIAIRRSAV
jgi:hypothetical protein